MLSNALVIPHFDYASPVWSNCSHTCQTKLQTLHNRLARTILSADVRTPINFMMSSLQWIKLNERWNDQMLIITFKCLKNISPNYLSSQFDFVHNNHTYTTRNHTSNTLMIFKCNSNSCLRIFHFRTGDIWNNISAMIRIELNNMSLSQFKSYISNSALL